MSGVIDDNIIRLLLKELGIGIVFVDRNNIIRYVNPAFERIKQTGDQKLINRSVFRCHPEGLKTRVEDILKKMKNGELKEWQKIAVESEPLLETRVTPLHDDDGRYIGSMLTVYNMTLYRELMEGLRKSQKELAALFKASEAMNSSLKLNDALFQILLLAKEVINFNTGSIYLLKEEGDELILAASMDCLLEGRQIEVIDYNSSDNIIACAVRSGRIITLRRGQEQFNELKNRPSTNVVMVLPLKKEDAVLGALVVECESESIFEMDQQGILMTFANHAAVAVRNAQLFTRTEQMAIMDGLTGLYNRQYFDHLLINAVAHAKRKKNPLSIMMIDVNDLKHINDYHGHVLGDYIISAAAGVLRESVRESDTVCRYGGDEMVILMPDTGEVDVQNIYQRILDRVDMWNQRENDYPSIRMSLSIGWASGRESEGMNELLSTADKRMYEDKRRYKLRRKAESPDYHDDRGDIE